MTHPLPLGASETFALWPDGAPLDPAKGLTEKIFPNPDPKVPERWIRNVRQATLTHFPAASGDGRSVLVVPGGGFHFVSIDNEGYDMARALTEQGITAFVLKYRVQPMPEDDATLLVFLTEFWKSVGDARRGETSPSTPALDAGRLLAEEDGRQAMRLLRSKAADLRIDRTKIGVLGFSAGGAVAVDLAIAAPAEARAAFSGAIYPAYRMLPIPPNAAPLFLGTAADDPVVPPYTAAHLGEAYHKAGRPAELHIYGNGGHGFGIRKQGNLSDGWFGDFIRWLTDTLPPEAQ